LICKCAAVNTRFIYIYIYIYIYIMWPSACRTKSYEPTTTAKYYAVHALGYDSDKLELYSR